MFTHTHNYEPDSLNGTRAAAAIIVHTQHSLGRNQSKEVSVCLSD